MRASEAIIRATVEILAERGFSAVKIETIAARAGTGRPTLYRRWSTKEDLVEEAIRTTFAEVMPQPDTGSLRGDLIALNREFIDSFSTQVGKVLLALIGEATRDARWARVLSEFQRRSRVGTSAIIDRAVARGELPADVDGNLVLDLIAGPVWSHALVWRDIATEAGRVEEIVDVVLAGVRATSTSSPRRR